MLNDLRRILCLYVLGLVLTIMPDEPEDQIALGFLFDAIDNFPDPHLDDYP